MDAVEDREAIERIVDIAMERWLPEVDSALQEAIRKAILLNELEILRILEPFIARIAALEKAVVTLAWRTTDAARTPSHH